MANITEQHRFSSATAIIVNDPVSIMALNQKQPEISEIASETLFATLTLQETLDKLMLR